VRPGGPPTADQSRRVADGGRSVPAPSSEPTGGSWMTKGELTAKRGVLRSDKATCLSWVDILASGGTSKDDSASAINAVDEVGGATGTPWPTPLWLKKSAMPHVGNGAVNGSRMRTTSQTAENFESMMFGRLSYKISTRQPSPHHLEAFLLLVDEKPNKSNHGCVDRRMTFMLMNGDLATFSSLMARPASSAMPARTAMPVKT
jgi:hypothetical protein